MATNRLDILTQMLEQDQNNTFARYGLAMEYANSGDYAKAVEQYETLLRQDQGYVAAYYHGGQALEKLGRLEEAKTVYEHGVTACIQKGDGHTRAEIEAALSMLPV